MKIATFNIWNSDTKRDLRVKATCLALEQIDADIVALQEVWPDGNSSVCEQLGAKNGYKYIEFRRYPDDPKEGLAFLSKHPIESVSAVWETVPALQIAVRAVFLVNKIRLAVTNVHLDWRSILLREQQIVALDRWLTDQHSKDTYEILCGDFNSPSESSVHRFLTGRQSLENRATLWTDVAEYYAERTKNKAAVTLDFYNNPRWEGQSNIEIPMRCDWILLKQSYPNPSPAINTAEVFGTTDSKGVGVVPSDHYGVVADMEFPPVAYKNDMNM